MPIEARNALNRLGYVILGAVVVMAWVVSAPAKVKTLDLTKYNFKRALTVEMPYVPDGVFEEKAVYFRHICCDCANTHDVVIFIREDSIEQNWLTNSAETRRRRRIQGIESRDPFSGLGAEHRVPGEQ
jgi:hypothetical protein